MRTYLVRTLFLLVAWTVSLGGNAADITGAGATFPYPIYAKWADAYKTQTGVGMNYQSIGSGGGIKQIKAKTVDFGASDMPLMPEELEQGRADAVPSNRRRRRTRRKPGRCGAGAAAPDRPRARRHLSRKHQDLE